MRYVVWTIRLVIFIAVLFFAFKNVTPVDVVFYDGLRLTQVPLIVVILLAFVAGAAFGAVLMLPGRMKRWREAGRLRKDLARANASPSAKSSVPATPVSSDSAKAGTSPL